MFSNEKVQHYSYLDNIIISKCLLNCVNDFEVVDNALNMSDHVPIMIKFNYNYWCKVVLEVETVNQVKSGTQDTCCQTVLRWDHADLNTYYNMTLQMFEPIFRVHN